MQLKLEFSGGLEILFGNQKEVQVQVPDSTGQLTVGRLLPWVKDHLLQERPELFLKGDSVRPGILVLINDCDWELSGTLDAELQEGDTVMFISTLHGG